MRLLSKAVFYWLSCSRSCCLTTFDKISQWFNLSISFHTTYIA